MNEHDNDSALAFDRVNSFIAGGMASLIDSDLAEVVKTPTGGLKDACWSGYTAVGMKMKGGRQVPNCVPKSEAANPAQQAAIAIAMKKAGKKPKTEEAMDEATKQQKAAGAALATQRGDYAGGKKGGAVNRMALMKTKDLVKLARNKKTNEEVEQVDELSTGTLNSYKSKAAGSERSLTDKSSTLSVPAKDRNAAAVKANQRRQGMNLATKKIGEEADHIDEAGLPSSMTGKYSGTPNQKTVTFRGTTSQTNKKLKDYKARGYDFHKHTTDNGKHNYTMKHPDVKEEAEQVDEISSKVYKSAMNKASNRAMYDAQGTSGPRYKKYAPMARKFQAKGIEQEKKEKAVSEANRVADVRMVKVKLPDGRVVYRKEHPKAEIQHEAAHTHPTGKIPYGDMTNKELRDALPKKVKAASEAYTGSEPTSSNKNDSSNRFVGTDAIRKNYASVTPGQTQEMNVAAFAADKPFYDSARNDPDSGAARVQANQADASKKNFSDIKKAISGIRESNDLNEAFSAGFELAPFAKDFGITVKSCFEHHPEVQEQLEARNAAVTTEATYKGKTVPLNKPMVGDVKKSKVYVDPDGDGKAKKVNFGDKKLSIKKGIPARKKSYCARSSGQGNLTNKSSANYWSRRAWDC